MAKKHGNKKPKNLRRQEFVHHINRLTYTEMMNTAAMHVLSKELALFTKEALLAANTNNQEEFDTSIAKMDKFISQQTDALQNIAKELGGQVGPVGEATGDSGEASSNTAANQSTIGCPAARDEVAAGTVWDSRGDDAAASDELLSPRALPDPEEPADDC